MRLLLVACESHQTEHKYYNLIQRTFTLRSDLLAILASEMQAVGISDFATNSGRNPELGIPFDMRTTESQSRNSGTSKSEFYGVSGGGVHLRNWRTELGIAGNKHAEYDLRNQEFSRENTECD